MFCRLCLICPFWLLSLRGGELLDSSWGSSVGLKMIPPKKDLNLSPKLANLDSQIGSKIGPEGSWGPFGGSRGLLEGVPGESASILKPCPS